MYCCLRPFLYICIHNMNRMIKKTIFIVVIAQIIFFNEGFSQNIFLRMDSLLSLRYARGNIDTAYVKRPDTKWTITARTKTSGTRIKAEGIDHGSHFKSEMRSDYKTTFCLGVSYLGVTLSAAINPAKLMGKYNDYEFSLKSYGRRFGFDLVYQDANSFNGWHKHDGMTQLDLPDGILSVKTLNLNAFYILNSRRFSYPAAFSQNYIQKRSAGSLLMAFSAQGQHAFLDYTQDLHLKMTNIGIGVGYGYNYVPSKSWLLHISALPTFIFYSHTSMKFKVSNVPLRYHFPETIITGRGAVIRQWKNKFVGLTMVYNFTNIGKEHSLAIHNIKWQAQLIFGMRLGKR